MRGHLLPQQLRQQLPYNSCLRSLWPAWFRFPYACVTPCALVLAGNRLLSFLGEGVTPAFWYPTADLLELVSDPGFISKLFKLVSQVLTEQVPEAQQVVYQVLTGSLGNATELSGSGAAFGSQSASQGAMVEDAMELFNSGVAMLHDEARFKQAMELILAALGQEGA